MVDYCFLDPVDWASAGIFRSLDRVPEGQWRGLSSLRGDRYSSLTEGKYWLLQKSCSVEALDIRFSKEDDWYNGSNISILSDPACKLIYLGYACSDIDVPKLSEFLLSSLQTSRLRYLGICGLKVQLRRFKPTLKEQSLELIARVLGDGACLLRGLLLNIHRVQDARALGTALVQPGCNLRSLALNIPSSEDQDWDWVDQLLRNPACKLLNLRLTGYRLPHLQVLRCGLERLNLDGFTIAKPPNFCHKLKEIRFGVVDLRDLPVVLQHPDCKLESLVCRVAFSPSRVTDLVNALECNISLCSLDANIPSNAQARVSNLLRRNRLFKEGGLLEQPQVQPCSARLFLCGHPRVGKTTIRKNMKRRGISYLQGLSGEPPTRGMELQTLVLGEKKKLVLCDLAGHKEYHAFHHFFLTGSDRDLFLVVCKETDKSDQTGFSIKLQYWFRFIASHRTPGKPRPKVIVVLNFFFPVCSTDHMRGVASDRTRSLLQEYADVLDFGDPGDSNVFAIDARKHKHYPPIMRRVEDLLTDLLDTRSRIPKICDDIISVISKSTAKMTLPRKRERHFCPLRHLASEYASKFCNETTKINYRTFCSALVELHNAGQIVFFPPLGEQVDMDQIVILDCQWFCCKLIGRLMQPVEMLDHGQSNLPEEPGVWREEDIKGILMEQKCQREFLPKVLEYLERLEFFYRLSPLKLMIPSLLPEALRLVQWLKWEDKATFFGRRLECKDKDKTLLPAGTFARLQVKLHSKFGNPSWQVGCGWIQFVENRVVVIVRFGGASDRWEDRHWIDIMVCYPEPREQHECIAEKIILLVKNQIFSICHGIDRSVPAVFLRECVMSEAVVRALISARGDVVPLDTIKEKVCKEGFQYYLPWSDGSSTPILDSFLPGEVSELVSEKANALRKIAQEFQVADSDNAPSVYEDEQQCCETLTDASLRELQHFICARFDKVDKELKDMSEGFRSKMESILQKLKQEEANILESCSYQLMKDLLTGPLPAFPFLTDKKGLWQPIKNLVGKEVDLHFMCEWYAAAHEVEDQKGLPVRISRPEWLARAVPVLVPALKVACCAARLAATILLPGSQVFVPSSGSVSGLGLSGEGLQHQVLPDILKNFVDGAPDLQELAYHQQLVDESRLKEFLFDLMKGKNVDMETHFQLYRVEMPQAKRLGWVCRAHSQGLQRLQNQNPFQ